MAIFTRDDIANGLMTEEERRALAQGASTDTATGSKKAAAVKAKYGLDGTSQKAKTELSTATRSWGMRGAQSAGYGRGGNAASGDGGGAWGADVSKASIQKTSDASVKGTPTAGKMVAPEVVGKETTLKSSKNGYDDTVNTPNIQKDAPLKQASPTQEKSYNDGEVTKTTPAETVKNSPYMVDYSSLSPDDIASKIMGYIEGNDIAALEDFLSWAEAESIARERMDPLYNKYSEQINDNLTKAALKSGFYGQLPAEAIKNSALQANEAEKVQAIVDYARDLVNESKDAALNKSKLKMADTESKVDGLMRMLGYAQEYENSKNSRSGKGHTQDSTTQTRANETNDENQKSGGSTPENGAFLSYTPGALNATANTLGKATANRAAGGIANVNYQRLISQMETLLNKKDNMAAVSLYEQYKNRLTDKQMDGISELINKYDKLILQRELNKEKALKSTSNRWDF